MRPRKTDTGLPRGVYLKHGAYYRVIKNQWHRLGTTPDCVNNAPIGLPSRMPEYKREILAFAYDVLRRSKQNARGRGGREFSLAREDIHRMLNESGWRCAVTGKEFTLELVNGKRPFAPSIDRKDCAVGYVPGNCRIVCVAVNYAMNVWGEDVLWRLFSRRVLDTSNGLDEIVAK